MIVKEKMFCFETIILGTSAFYPAVKNPLKITNNYELLLGVMGNMIIPFGKSARLQAFF